MGHNCRHASGDLGQWKQSMRNEKRERDSANHGNEKPDFGKHGSLS